jgi:hypothetical protein
MLAALCPAHQAREPLFIANPSDFANPSERCGNPRDGDNNIIEAMNLENTKVKAFWRVAPSVRLSVFAILPARVFFRASVFKVRTSAVVQDRRLPFFMIRFLPIVGTMAR